MLTLSEHKVFIFFSPSSRVFGVQQTAWPFKPVNPAQLEMLVYVLLHQCQDTLPMPCKVDLRFLGLAQSLLL